MFGSLKPPACNAHGYSKQNVSCLIAPTRVRLQCARALANQGGCHFLWNEALLALRSDDSPRPRSGSGESIGYCLRRFSVATRMRSGAWMLDTSMCIAPTKILLDRVLSQAGVLDRVLSYATWATYWSNGALWTRQRSTRDSASLHPCRQAASFLPCARPTDACGSSLARDRKSVV